MIATYALCGFSNFGSIGIELGVLGTMAPNRKTLLSNLAFRALIAGSITCFLTACLAGILVETPFVCLPQSQGNCFDVGLIQKVVQNITETITKSVNSHNEL